MHRDKLALLLPILVPAIFLGTILAIMLLPAGIANASPDAAKQALARHLVEAQVAYDAQTVE